jgi:hypothetical protein
VFEFHKIIPMLTDPERFGGDPADAFTVVAPSLPGYTFSFRPGQARFSVEQMATVTERVTEWRSAKRTRTVTVRPGRDFARSRVATLSAR